MVVWKRVSSMVAVLAIAGGLTACVASLESKGDGAMRDAPGGDVTLDSPLIEGEQDADAPIVGELSQAVKMPDNRGIGFILRSEDSRKVSKVEVSLNIKHPRLADVGVVIWGPDNTRAILAYPNTLQEGVMTFTVADLAGKPIAGRWLVGIFDVAQGETGVIEAFRLAIHPEVADSTEPPDDGDGGDTDPPDNGDGGDTTDPPDNGDGGDTNPPDDGGDTPPDNGDGGDTDPPDNGGGGDTTPPDNGVPQFVSDVLRLTNDARATGYNCGGQSFGPAPALQNDLELNKAAQAHSQDMADKNYFSHTGADGSSFADRIRRTDFQGSPGGENIAAGQRTAEQVVAGWLKSPGHCRNIMNSSFRYIGIGMANGGSYGIYWTQKFGR